MRPSEIKLLKVLSKMWPMTYSQLYRESGIISMRSFNDAKRNLLRHGLIRRTGKNGKLLTIIPDVSPRELMLQEVLHFISGEERSTSSGEVGLLVTEEPAIFETLFDDPEFQEVLKNVQNQVLQRFLQYYVAKSDFGKERIDDAMEYLEALEKGMELLAPGITSTEKLRQFGIDQGPMTFFLPLNPGAVIDELKEKVDQVNGAVEVLQTLTNHRRRKSYAEFRYLVNTEKRTIILVPILGFQGVISRSSELRRLLSSSSDFNT